VGTYRDGILDRSFFVISTPKAKMIQPKTCDVGAPQERTTLLWVLFVVMLWAGAVICLCILAGI
jgi:hypothetical protein